jgi:hypothetical protein
MDESEGEPTCRIMGGIRKARLHAFVGDLLSQQHHDVDDESRRREEKKEKR